MPQDYDNYQILDIIKSALELTGQGSKQVILDYLHVRYGMDTKLIVEYKDEFENYLRETLGDSAEIIISKIESTLYEFTNNCNGHNHHHNKNNNKNKNNAALQERKRSRSRRITDVIHFLICDNCFWCASILGERYESKCLSCGSQIVSSVPVMSNEKFIVEVDKKRGVSLSFK